METVHTCNEGKVPETGGFTRDGKESGKAGLMARAFRAFMDMMVRPGKFFEGLDSENGYGPALLFLFSVCVFFSVLASLFVMRDKPLFALIFFLNAFAMPFVTAFVLYLVAMLLCKDTFTYQTLFAVTAYANVALLAAWIPGLAWMTGIWKFYLIGLGMTRTGRISGLKAFLCLLSCAVILIILAHFLQPVLKH